MPDVRDVIARLKDEDKAVFTEHRTCMRKCYLAAINATIGIDKFEQQDDSFLDLIDIRLALLFDRAGWLSTDTKITGKEEGDVITQEIISAEDEAKVKKYVPKNEQGDAIKMLNETWGSGASK